jgi:hypothetical protein
MAQDWRVHALVYFCSSVDDLLGAVLHRHLGLELVDMKTNKFPEDIGPYTTGVWRCHQGNHGEFLVSCESFGFAPIARVKGDKRSTLKDAKANAHLIAAAPDLLTALYAVMNSCFDPALTEGEAYEAFDLARDAIAKAEGFK